MKNLKDTLVQLDPEFFFPANRAFPFPTAWEDQVSYFLMLDRFSDNQENGYQDNAGNLVRNGTTPMYTKDDRGNTALSAQVRTSYCRKATLRAVFLQ
ncbi:MAG: hypothetical protein Kow00121_45190 [Elainellaceae cyanobacterium]